MLTLILRYKCNITFDVYGSCKLSGQIFEILCDLINNIRILYISDTECFPGDRERETDRQRERGESSMLHNRLNIHILQEVKFPAVCQNCFPHNFSNDHQMRFLYCRRLRISYYTKKKKIEEGGGRKREEKDELNERERERNGKRENRRKK